MMERLVSSLTLEASTLDKTLSGSTGNCDCFFLCMSVFKIKSNATSRSVMSSCTAVVYLCVFDLSFAVSLGEVSCQHTERVVTYGHDVRASGQG